MKFKRITAALLALSMAASSTAVLYGSAAQQNNTHETAVMKSSEQTPAAPVFIDAVKTSAGAQFTWSRVSGVDGYMLYHYNQTGDYKHVILGADVTTYVWKDFDPTYTYAIVSYVNLDSETIKSEPSIIEGKDVENADVAEIKPPAMPKYIKTGRAKSALRVYWEPLECDGVEVSFRKEGDTEWKIAGYDTQKANNLRVSSLSPDTKYQFRIRGYNLDSLGNKVFGVYNAGISAATLKEKLEKPATVKINKAGKTFTAIRIYWDPVPCTGYEVYVYKKNGWELVGKADSYDNSYRINDLDPDTPYWFTVRAYTESDISDAVVYGDFSNHKKATTKKLQSSVSAPKKVKITKANKTHNAVRLFWEHQDCEYYQIYRKIGDKYVNTDIISGKEDSFRISGLDPATDYYFKVRAYNTLNGNKVLGEYSDEIKVTTKYDPNDVKIENKNGITYVNGVLIVNKTYSIPSTYAPGGLTSDTAAAFSKMQQAAAKDGISLWNASGYRSYSYQGSLYNGYVARDGKAAADRYSARPGYSEHQTGLALDVNGASSSFTGSKEAKWLAQHCSEYGFIIRYPEGKESSTGYMYESWHIRYLGTDLAKKVTESGKSLEEYFGITSVYSN